MKVHINNSAGNVHVDVVFQWGSSLNLLAANNSNTVLILCEHLMSAHYSQQVAAVQLTPVQLSITQFSTGAQLGLQSDMHIKGVCVSKVGVKSAGEIVAYHEYSPIYRMFAILYLCPNSQPLLSSAVQWPIKHPQSIVHCNAVTVNGREEDHAELDIGRF